VFEQKNEIISIYYALESGYIGLLPSGYDINNHEMNRNVYKYIYLHRRDLFRLTHDCPEQLNHGWLLEKIEWYDYLFYGRRQYWKDVQAYRQKSINKTDFDRYCNVIDFKMTQDGLEGWQKLLYSIGKEGVTIESLDYLLDWLLFGLGHPAYPSLPTPPLSVIANASDMLKLLFHPALFFLTPYDYLGDIYYSLDHHPFQIDNPHHRPCPVNVLSEDFWRYGLGIDVYYSYKSIKGQSMKALMELSKLPCTKIEFLDTCYLGREYLVEGNYFMNNLPIANNLIVGKILLINLYFYVPWYADVNYHNGNYLPNAFTQLNKLGERESYFVQYTNKVLAFFGLNHWAEVDWDIYPAIYPITPIKVQSDRYIAINGCADIL
jgi:hypothetical protein